MEQSSQVNSHSHIIEIELDSAVLAIMRQHKIHDIAVIPGALLVSSVVDCVEQLGHRVSTLSRIEFPSVLEIPTDAASSLKFQIRLEKSDTSAWRAICLSVGNNEHRHAVMDVDLVTGEAAGFEPVGEPTFDSGPGVAGEAIYAAFSSRGNGYSGPFAGIQTLSVDQGHLVAVLDNGVSSPDALSRYRINPVTLDLLVQALAYPVLTEGSAFFLQSIERLELVGSQATDTSQKLICTSTGIDAETTLSGTLLCGGNVLLTLSGLRLGHIPSVDAGEADPRDVIAIQSTFTIEPVEPTISYWTELLGIESSVKFAPYNQVFQQLLDPGSVLSANTKGLNVTALRLEDWAHDKQAGDSTEAGNASANSAVAVPEHVSSFQLPDGTVIGHVNRYETEYLYSEIFLDRCYLRNGITLDGAECVIDIGANIGMFSMFVQTQAPNARVLAFEPGAAVFDALKHNVGIHNSNGQVFNVGVADVPGEATFTYYDNSTVFSTFSMDADSDEDAIRAVIENMMTDGSEVKLESADVEDVIDNMLDHRLESKEIVVPITTLAEIISENGITKIDLLKVDAEKSELNILKGMTDDNWNIVNQVVIEVHDKQGDVIEEVLALLNQHGFEYDLTEEELLRDSGLYNIYAIRKGMKSGRELPLLTTLDKDRVTRSTEEFIDAAEAFSARSPAHHQIVVCPPREKYSKAAADKDFLAASASSIMDRLSRLSNVDVVLHEELEKRYRIGYLHNPIGDQEGRVPYTPEYFAALGSVVARKHHALRSGASKVIVLDCDNTLWSGVCAEDGVAGVVLDADREYFQSRLKNLKNQGVLLTLCSKNEEADVKSTFMQHPEWPLQWSDFTTSRINWQSKSANIIEIANELDLSVNSFVFFDDNPLEVADVRSALPSVVTLTYPTTEDGIRSMLDHCWVFDDLHATSESRNRTEMYKDNAKRKQLEQSTGSLKEFIDSLELSIAISEIDDSKFERASELTLRTSQFNFSTRQKSVSEVTTFLSRQDTAGFTVQVSDRFGDYGTVGLLLLVADDMSVVVETFLLSCRVLGRGVEHKIAAFIGDFALERSLTQVGVDFQRTGRNAPANSFLQCLPCSTEETDGTMRRYVGTSTDFSSVIYSAPEAAAADVSASTGLSEGNATSVYSRYPAVAEQVATSLVSAEAILEQVVKSRTKGVRPDLMTQFEPPVSEQEIHVADVWRGILNLDKVGLDDNFFQLGGTSLKAVEMVAVVRSQGLTQLSIVKVFENPTIRGILSGDGGPDGQPVNVRKRTKNKRRRAET